ncbi:hypothetical protein T4B_274, partial [Trichinella pseudospiralis]
YVLSDAGRFLIDSNIRYFRNIYISSESVDAHAVESANRQNDIGSGCRSSKSGVFLQPLDHHQSFNRTVKIHCWWLDYVLSDAGRFLIDSNSGTSVTSIYHQSQWMHMLLRVRIAKMILEVVVDHRNQECFCSHWIIIK